MVYKFDGVRSRRNNIDECLEEGVKDKKESRFEVPKVESS